eukprot:GGOE01027260.1.p1 GENE.GGOE01027260.1~~GGOE01027260.1.p1  ORF type:complete len:539 (-),score=141.31 GGOE01027260.1:177-1769(-)
MDPHVSLFRVAGASAATPRKFPAAFPVTVGCPPPQPYMDRFSPATMEEATAATVMPGSPTSPWAPNFAPALPPISVGTPPPIGVFPSISVGTPPSNLHSPPRAMPISPFPGSPIHIQPPVPHSLVPSPHPMPPMSPPRRATPLTGLPGCISQAHKLLSQLEDDFQVSTSKILHIQRTNPVLTAQVLAKLAFSCALNKPPAALCYAQFIVHLRAWIKESERSSFEEELFAMVKGSFEKLLPAMASWGNADVGQHAKVLLGSMQFLGEICMEGLVSPEQVEGVLAEIWPSASASATECGIRVKMTCTLLGIVMPKYEKSLLRQHLVALKRLAEAKPNPFIGFLIDQLLEDARQKVQWFGVTGIPSSGVPEREEQPDVPQPAPEPDAEPKPEPEPEPKPDPQPQPEQAAEPEHAEPDSEQKAEAEPRPELEPEPDPDTQPDEDEVPSLPAMADLPPPLTWQELHAKRLRPSPSMMSDGLSWPMGDEVPGMAFDPELMLADQTPRSGDLLGNAGHHEARGEQAALPNAAAGASW